MEQHFDEFIISIYFKRSKYYKCVYFKFLVDDHFIVLLYVNDILIA